MGARGGVGAGVGAGIGFMVAGPLGAAIGAGIGGGIGGVGDSVQTAKKQATMLGQQLNLANRKEQKPIVPTQDMDQIRASKNLKSLQLSQRSGSSSTILTDRLGG